MCNTFTTRNWSGIPFVKESEDRMKLLTIEMAKLNVNKPPEEMNEQEKMIYYKIGTTSRKRTYKIDKF